jgi:hemerythrin-like domain-containing protein
MTVPVREVVMKPRGPLMIEHRLIEKFLVLLERELGVITAEKKADPVFVDTVVDFIRTYADRTHHGKEEDILFRDLAKKPLKGEDAVMMKELLDDHTYARSLVGELVAANRKYAGGNASALEIIVEKLSALARFYPEHIVKEDRVFFPNTEKYFSNFELDAMLEEFKEFDMKMIHEKYQKQYEVLLSRYK